MKPIVFVSVVFLGIATTVNGFDTPQSATDASVAAFTPMLKKAVTSAGIVGVGYWMTKHCKDFFKEYDPKNNKLGLLPTHISQFQGNEYLPTLARETVTAALYVTLLVSIKSLISQQMNGDVPTGSGKSKILDGRWNIGASLAFAHLAYQIFKGSDALNPLQKLYNQVVAKFTAKK